MYIYVQRVTPTTHCPMRCLTFATIRHNQTFFFFFFFSRIKRPRKHRIYDTSHFYPFRLCVTTMSLQRYAFCLLPLALLSRVFLGCKALMFFNVHEELSTARDLENRILDVIESPIRYYLRSDVDHHDVDLNLMLGVSIMKGKGYLFGFRNH